MCWARSRRRFAFAPLLGFALLAQPAAAQPAPPKEFPANLRWELVPKWIKWIDNRAQIRWPPNDGCASPPQTKPLPVGTLIDRMGSEIGSWFYAKGESFAERSLPYAGRQLDYRMYRVLKPLAVRSCGGAPWFDQPGGARQLQGSAPANRLAQSDMLERVSYRTAGNSGFSSPP